MKIQSIKIISGLFLMALSLFADEWQTIHGHSGYIENKSALSSDDGHYTQYGLWFRMQPSTINWLHWSFEVPEDNGVDKIKFSVFTGSDKTKFDIIDVFNGNSKLYSKYIEVSGGWQTFEVDLGKTIEPHDGLGISLRVTTSDPNFNGRIVKISSVGAHFVTQ